MRETPLSRIGCVCKRNCFCCHIPYLKLCVNLSSFLRGVPCPQPPRKPKGIGLEYHNAPDGEQNSIMWQIWGPRREKVVFSGSKMRLSFLPTARSSGVGALVSWRWASSVWRVGAPRKGRYDDVAIRCRSAFRKVWALSRRCLRGRCERRRWRRQSKKWCMSHRC